MDNVIVQHVAFWRCQTTTPFTPTAEEECMEKKRKTKFVLKVVLISVPSAWGPRALHREPLRGVNQPSHTCKASVEKTKTAITLNRKRISTIPCIKLLEISSSTCTCKNYRPTMFHGP